ncbi:hypothetical protein G3N59_29640 [Paraburkholderia sp. Ac-20340]|uniref:hypothetical protein n=1 Tax=Paraburkholderia sp. Ac-20340 TaxID=2703888 RepID=UPI00197ECA10|nr:hypothetical protein [Paraburkholderia sp. Ac-20340]MBN3857557.1 hypothetical protein [Paraburkholderia sp. Ac-20340]
MTEKAVAHAGGECTRSYSLARGQVLVEIRYGEGVTRLSDLDDLRSEGEIEVVVLSPVRSAAEQLCASFGKLKHGDALIVYVADDKLYKAAVDALNTHARESEN